MPIPTLNYILNEGVGNIPYFWAVAKTLPWLFALYCIKSYCGGAVNTSERKMHSKVIIMTGGTSGIGAAVARDLATRGAQLVLLTQQPLTDPFLADYILDLRAQTGNELITAEHVDLGSLHSIRKFATKWVDNAPPRRLDMVILCAGTMTPALSKPHGTEDGLEAVYGINYVSNFHLLSILSPALRAQPPDRDVRILLATCASYMGGRLFPGSATASSAATQRASKKKPPASSKPAPAPPTPTLRNAATYATSKLALTTFAHAFQAQLATYAQPDKQPANTHVLLVDPGFTRTPGMRRFLALGSLWGLLAYLLAYPLWWLVLKAPEQGAQSFLFAAMEARFGRGDVVRLVKECREVAVSRREVVLDQEAQARLCKETEELISVAERDAAVRRARESKDKPPPKTDGTPHDAVSIHGPVAAPSGSSEGGPGSARKAGSRRSRKAA